MPCNLPADVCGVGGVSPVGEGLAPDVASPCIEGGRSRNVTASSVVEAEGPQSLFAPSRQKGWGRWMYS